MKRPLKDNEIPPGSWIWKGPVYAKLLIITIHTIGVEVLCNNHVTYISWKDLKQYRITQDPRKPWEDWQPCWVDEFNPADYKPGQEVDIPTARKLHAAGVELEFIGGAIKEWQMVAQMYDSDSAYSSIGYKFRIALPPKMRDIRPDELPDTFLVTKPGSLTPWVSNRHTWTPDKIKKAVKDEWLRSDNALSGPWNSFQVEDK